MSGKPVNGPVFVNIRGTYINMNTIVEIVGADKEIITATASNPQQVIDVSNVISITTLKGTQLKHSSFRAC